MKSPWKAVRELDADVEYLVLATSIPPKSYASTWALFKGSRTVRRQLLATDGVLGFSMLAEPFRKHYATLSVWRDEQALDAFAATDPHGRIMGELAAAMNAPQFIRWMISGSDGVPSGTDALNRLEIGSAS
jgi:quinol monooxygenase YgiN